MLWLLFCNTFNKGKTQALKGSCCLHCVSRDPLAPIFVVWLQWRGGCCGLSLSDRTDGAVFPHEAGWGEENPLEGSTLFSPRLGAPCRRAQVLGPPRCSRAVPEGPCLRAGRPLPARRSAPCSSAVRERRNGVRGACGIAPELPPSGLHCPKGCGQAPAER